MPRKNGDQELVKAETNANVVAVPDYLKGDERTGTERLGKGDFKIPRVKLLDPKSPEVVSFSGKAIPGEFWHTGANVSLGSEFLMVPCVVGKKVIVWKPRDDGGGILAFSKDAINWDSGGNKTFEVTIKGGDKVKWSTGRNVQASGLLDFGTSNPKLENSAPAATLAYEYLIYLPDHPDLSPCVIGVQRTGSPNARALNSHLMMTRRPTSCCAIRVFSDKLQKGRDTWFAPKFDPAGYVNKDLYAITSQIAEQYAEYEVEIEPEDTAPVNEAVDDKISY